MKPQQLRHDLREGDDPEMRRRRAIIGLSLAGMAAMTPVSLLQTGLIRSLRDPVLGNSDQTNLADAAYQFGAPDGTLALASMAANVPLAAWGGQDRAREQPWVSLLAAGKALVDAIGAGAYFSRMASGKEPWCSYCVAGTIVNLSILALALPEAAAALRHLQS
jgi:Vitamin K epoxide reductase family